MAKAGKTTKPPPTTTTTTTLVKPPTILNNQQITNKVVKQLNGNGPYTSREQRRKNIRTEKAKLMAPNILKQKKNSYTEEQKTKKKEKNNIAQAKKEAYEKKIATEAAATEVTATEVTAKEAKVTTPTLLKTNTTSKPVIHKVASPPTATIATRQQISNLVGEITKPGDGEVPKTKKRANLNKQKQTQQNITIKNLLNVEKKLKNIENQ